MFHCTLSFLLKSAFLTGIQFLLASGHYCVGGVAVPCPAGTYGAREGLQNLRDCTICPAGRSSTVTELIHDRKQCQSISLSCKLETFMITLSKNTFLKVFTVWKAAHRDPPPTSCAHRGFSVKRAPPPLMGHLARLVQQGNNWVRQVGQPVRDVKKDGSVLQASLNTPNTGVLKKRLDLNMRIDSRGLS